MSAIAAKQKTATSRGRRRSATEVAERVAYVRGLVLSVGRDRAKVHEGFIERYGATPARTIDEYLSRVDRAWLRDAEEQTPNERASFLTKLDVDAKLYATHKAWSAHASVRKLEARVRGLDALGVNVSGGLTLIAGHAPAEAPLTPELVRLVAEGLQEERARLGLLADNESESDADPNALIGSAGK